MFEKKQPQVESYRLQVVEAQMKVTGFLSLTDIDFYSVVYNSWGGKLQEIPPEVSSITARAQMITYDEEGNKKERYPLLRTVSCSQVIPSDQF